MYDNIYIYIYIHIYIYIYIWAYSWPRGSWWGLRGLHFGVDFGDVCSKLSATIRRIGFSSPRCLFFRSRRPILLIEMRACQHCRSACEGEHADIHELPMRSLPVLVVLIDGVLLLLLLLLLLLEVILFIILLLIIVITSRKSHAKPRGRRSGSWRPWRRGGGPDTISMTRSLLLSLLVLLLLLWSIYHYY